MIKIICVGKLKEKYLVEALEEYQRRLSKYTKLEIIEVLDENFNDIEKVKEKEADKIKKYLNEKDYLITLEIEGQELTSEEFAKKIDNTLSINSNITFLIGGSYGLSKELKHLANYHLSFSKMTFPHQLFRVILLEQLYRAFKINHNESYHK